MIFDVEWSPDAENELAAIWTRSRDREGVAVSSNKIDRSLTLNAHEAGESRPAGLRIVFEAPLGALFAVDLASSKALVVHVWEFRV